MNMKSARAWFGALFFTCPQHHCGPHASQRLLAALQIICLFLIILISAPMPGFCASEESTNVNELLGQEDTSDGIEDRVPIPTDPDIMVQPSETPTETSSELPPETPPADTPETAPPADEDLAPAVAPAAPAAPPPPLNLSQKVVMIGRPPFISVKEMLILVKGLTEFLRKEMGVKDVRVVTAKNYSGVLSALSRGTIDFAWLGPTSYVIAAAKTPLTPLAKAKRRTGATYHGVFLTRKDSKILGLDDIKGKVLGFVDPESASGYLYPLYFLKRAGINPYKQCRKVEFLQKHDAVLSAVLSRKVDVGVCLEDNIANLKDRKILDQLLILGQTDEVPSDIVACRSDCHPTLRDAFMNALLKTATLNQNASASTGLPPIMQFMPVNEADIDAVRTVLKETKDIRQPH